MTTSVLIIKTLSVGAFMAVQVALGAFAIASSIGLVLALARTFVRMHAVQVAIAAWSEWMRNVPALVHLFLLYFGLASVGVPLPPVLAACLGLGLVGAAVLCDVFTAGLRSLHVGQREAALSVGLTPLQVLRLVLLPQALRVTLPSLGNYASQLMKDTSIASAIAVPEIMFYARNLVTSTFETTAIYIGAMLVYASIVMPITWTFARVERRMEAAR
ncbi:amino acid ABC transporter permease [Acidovorax sp. FG27]|uniref:amino acid ABC transporter permease n=1 Tax=Acidovorax sp. FG27 TaxID=3133652 RepID=UPI0030E85E40